MEALQKVLDAPQSATLLGGVQALLDGTRLVFERPAPDAGLMRGLWALLPTNSRCEMWPTSFVFAQTGRFHVAVVPTAAGRDPAAPQFSHYLTEEQAGDYPEGNYEWRLQSAVEHGDQREMDTLLARRSRRQMIQLAVVLLVVMALTPPLLSMLLPASPPAPPPAARARPPRSRTCRPPTPARR